MSTPSEFKTVYQPALLKAEPELEAKLPGLSYDPKRGKFVGDGLPSTDCLPIVIKGISVAKGDAEPWYSGPGLCVRLETYGGGGEEAGDLCCLFHSSGKALLPPLANVALPFVSKKEQRKESYRICHNFKADLASYCLSDTAEGRESSRAALEKEVKLRHILLDGTKLTLFVEKIKAKLAENKEEPLLFATQCLEAIAQRNELLAEERLLREKKRVLAKKERAPIKAELAALQAKLKADSLPYQKILTFLEAHYLDPRYEILTQGQTGQAEPQYAWPAELRALPLTMGLFSAMGVFEYSEWDIREQDLGATLAPTGGRIALPTLIDQLLSTMMYGIDYFRLLAAVTGFTIFMVTRSGEPHQQHVVTRVPTHEDIVQLVASRIIDPKDHYDALEYDPEAPCVVICFENSHFETVALLHECEVEGSEEKVWQAQTVFSFEDPFIQAIIARFRYNLKAKKGAVQKKAAANRSKTVASKVDPKQVDYTTMTVDEIVTHLKNTVPGIDEALGGEIATHARKLQEEALSEKLIADEEAKTDKKKSTKKVEKVEEENADKKSTKKVEEVEEENADKKSTKKVEKVEEENADKKKSIKKVEKVEEEEEIVLITPKPKQTFAQKVKEESTLKTTTVQGKKKEIDLSEMAAKDIVKYLDQTTEGWREALDEMEPLEYARHLREQARKEIKGKASRR